MNTGDRYARACGKTILIDAEPTSRSIVDNAAIESFKGRFHEECLNVHWFASIDDAQQKIDAFGGDYTEHHPHRALKGLSPREYAQKVLATAADSPS